MFKHLVLDMMAGNEGGLPPEERLSMSKIWVGFLPGLAGIEGVGGWRVGIWIVESRPFFRELIIFRHAFCMMFFDCFPGGFFFDFGAFCGAILALKTEPNRSSGPSRRILGAFWALFRVLLTQERALTRLTWFC